MTDAELYADYKLKDDGEPDPEDFRAVVYDGEVRCIECLPPGLDIDSAEVDPIFAGEEWCGPAICRICRFEHRYMNVV